MFFNSRKKCFVPRSINLMLSCCFLQTSFMQGQTKKNIREVPNVFLNAACALSTLNEEICLKFATTANQAAQKLSFSGMNQLCVMYS